MEQTRNQHIFMHYIIGESYIRAATGIHFSITDVQPVTLTVNLGWLARKLGVRLRGCL